MRSRCSRGRQHWRNKAATSSISALASRLKTPQHIVEAAIKALRDGHHGYAG
jgi:hypothetical protein